MHKLLEEMVKPVSTEGKTPKSVQRISERRIKYRAKFDAALAKGAQVAEDKECYRCCSGGGTRTSAATQIEIASYYSSIKLTKQHFDL